MTLKLTNIPDLSEENQTVHQIKALAFGDKNPVEVALLKWKRDCPNDFKKIMKAIRYAGEHKKNSLLNTNYVKRCDNPKYGEVYEFRNNRCPLRLMFFFDEKNTMIICTNPFKKNDAQRNKSGGQDTAFKLCADIRNLYNQHGAQDENN